MSSTVLIPWTVDKSLIKSDLNVADHLHELYTTTLDRIEIQHILRELKRTKANTKKIILIAIEYGDIDEYITKKEMEIFHNFILQLDVNDLTNDQYVSNKYKAEYLDMMGIINDEY
tara:strand:+ start:1559 stop:1906 length:348 start_codon:yes stop_codon:yes gene_type:complete